MRQDHLYQTRRGTGRTTKQLEKIIDYIIAGGKKRDIIYFTHMSFPQNYLDQLLYSLLKPSFLNISDDSHRTRLVLDTPNGQYTICFRHSKSLLCPSQYRSRNALFVYDHWLYEEAIADLMDDYEAVIDKEIK